MASEEKCFAPLSLMARNNSHGVSPESHVIEVKYFLAIKPLFLLTLKILTRVTTKHSLARFSSIPLRSVPLDPSPTPFVNYDFRTIDWRAISVFFAAVGILLVFYFQWWRNRKRLSYKVLSNVVLISAEKEIEDRVEIRFEGHSVKNVQLLVIRLINDGFQPIKKDDFEKSLEFVFPDAKILTAEKVKFHPDNLATQIAYRDEKLEIDPALFNRKDYIEFKVLVSGFKKLKVDARVIGISRIGNVTASFKSRWGAVTVVTLIQFLGGAAVLIHDGLYPFGFWKTLLAMLGVLLIGPVIHWFGSTKTEDDEL